MANPTEAFPWQDDFEEHFESFFQSATFHLYERLAYLDNKLVVPVYIICIIWRVAVSSAAGPAAVAIGAQMAHVRASSESLKIGLMLAALREAGIQIASLAFRLLRHLHTRQAGPDHRMIVDRYAFLLPGSGMRTWVAVSMVVAVLCSVILAYLCAAMGFAVGIAALGAKLALDEVPTELMIAALPAIVYLAFFQMLKLHAIGDLPLGIPNHAIAGAIYAHVYREQGFTICSTGTAAASGAVFALIACNVNVALESITAFVSFSKQLLGFAFRMRRSFDVVNLLTTPEGATKSRLDSILFGRAISIEEELFGPKYQISREDLEAAKNAEDEELRLHPNMQKVFLSRPTGLDKKTHYVLIVGDRKYELRLHGAPETRKEKINDAHDTETLYAEERKSGYANVIHNHHGKTQEREHLRYNTDLVEVRRYEGHKPGDFNSQHAGWHTRRLWNPTIQKYAPNLYDVLLIGWTIAVPEEIDYICSIKMEKWRYRKLVNTDSSGNCQNFVRIIADEICKASTIQSLRSNGQRSVDSPTDEYHASSWEWFRHDIYGPIQQAEYNRLRNDFWTQARGPLRVVRLRSPLEAGSEVTRFVARLQQLNFWPFKRDKNLEIRFSFQS